MMKFLKYILAIIISASAISVFACGPDYYEIPHPTYLQLSKDIADLDTRSENIKLWQQQTSTEISEKDIYDVIYGDVTPNVWRLYSYGYESSGMMSWNYAYGEKSTGENTFLNYIYNTNDEEALQFIMMAKHIAQLRDDCNSPWYYPSSPYEVEAEFDPVIKTIQAYKGTRFFNRYSLQLIRALFASARYEECIKAFNERFANVSEEDLMKRLSLDYAAGAALRLGDSKTAADYFALTGDVESLSRFTDVENPFKLAAMGNPDSPKLLYFIERHFNGNGYWYPYKTDSIAVKEIILPTARQIVKKKTIGNRAMWYYILAVGEGEFNNNYNAAYRYIKEAGKYPSSRFSDYIHGYRIVVEGALGKQNNLISNLKWLESKIADATSMDMNYWQQVMQNVIFTRIAPWYARRGDIITAMQLANYGDNMPLYYSASCWRYSAFYGDWQDDDVILARKEPKQPNRHDYSNTFFQYMTMQTPQTIERYIASLSSTSPLASYLNSRSYTSRDYLYDVVGTRYLSNRDYSNAVRALAHISDSYQQLLNVDRDGFLRRDPFVYKSELQKNDWCQREHFCNTGPEQRDTITNHKKLYFAREMLRLKREIRYAHNPNKRAMARLKYAIGMENSFNSCWALTSYSRGYCLIAARNELTDWKNLNDGECSNWNPFEEERIILKATADADNMRKIALAEITDPEVAARAHYMLYDVRTIARRYPNTKVGRMMATQCDAWSDWIKSPKSPRKIRKSV